MAQIDEPTPAVVPNEPKTEPVEEKIGPVRKIGRAVGSAAKVGMKGLSYVGPAAAKFAIKTTLAGAGAMTGIAAGLVSDDYGNVAKWGVAGAGSGVVAGGAINNNIPVLNGQGEALYSQYYTQMHGEDAEEARQVDIADDKARKDRARRRVFKEKFSIKTDKELDEIMDQAQEYRRAGVLDDKIIIQSMQADEKQFGKERDSEQKILLAQLATQVGKDKKELEYLEKSLKKRKLPEKDINQYVNTIRLWNNWS